MILTINRQRSRNTQVYVCVHFSPAPSPTTVLTKSKSSDTAVATTTPITQILISTSHTKAEKRLFGEMADFITGAGKAYDVEPGLVLSQKIRRFSKNDRDMSKGLQLDERGFYHPELGQAGLLICKNKENEWCC